MQVGAPMDLPSRLRWARRRNGLTQAELARELVVSKRLIVYWERGEMKPLRVQIEEIAAKLHVDVDWLEHGAHRPGDGSGAAWFGRPDHHGEAEAFVVATEKRDGHRIPVAARSKRAWRSFIERPVVPGCLQCGTTRSVLFGMCTPCFVSGRDPDR